MDDTAIERLNEPIEEITAANTELLGELEEIMGRLSVLIESADDAGTAGGSSALTAETLREIVSSQLSETIQSLRDATAALIRQPSDGSAPADAAEQLVQQQATIETLQRENRELKSELADLQTQSEQMIELLAQQQQLIDQADSMAATVRKLQQSLKAKARSQA